MNNLIAPKMSLTFPNKTYIEYMIDSIILDLGGNKVIEQRLEIPIKESSLRNIKSKIVSYLNIPENSVNSCFSPFEGFSFEIIRPMVKYKMIVRKVVSSILEISDLSS